MNSTPAWRKWVYGTAFSASVIKYGSTQSACYWHAIGGLIPKLTNANSSFPTLCRACSQKWKSNQTPRWSGQARHNIVDRSQATTIGISAYYLGRISTVTAIFPARIFKVLCGFFRPELSHIFHQFQRQASKTGRIPESIIISTDAACTGSNGRGHQLVAALILRSAQAQRG